MTAAPIGRVAGPASGRWPAGRGVGRRVRRRLRPSLVLVSAVLLLLGVLSGCESGGGSTTTSASGRVTPGTTKVPADSSYAVSCVAVGAAVNGPGRPASLFRQAQQELGPLTIRRSFDSGLPSSFQRSAAAPDPHAGVRSFVSWKPPNGDHAGAARGRYDRQITAWAESVPRVGVYATAWHEPENDMTAAEYVAFERHVYRVVKAANPDIRFGPVYMAYWWDSSAPNHYIGDPEAWWPGNQYADFAALDWYSVNPRPMTESASFATWYETVQPTGKPLYIAEYGQGAVKQGHGADPSRQQARARAIEQDAGWIADHPSIRMWLYWQADGAKGDWRIHDAASAEAWRQVADSGCQ